MAIGNPHCHSGRVTSLVTCLQQTLIGIKCWFYRTDEVASPTTPEMPNPETATVGTSGTAEGPKSTCKLSQCISLTLCKYNFSQVQNLHN